MKGLDIWYRYGPIDFQKVKASGIDFIFPRTGWGVDCDGKGIDPGFITYVSDAQKAGVSVPGVFHMIYGINEAEARQNAACAINAVRKAGLPKETIIWCDLEYDTVDNARDYRGVILTTDMQRKMAEAFCDYCLEQGYCTGIYLNADYINRVYGKDIIDHYDIWLSDLYGGPDYPCLYQQINWSATVPGIGTKADMDEYIGTYTAGTAKPQGDDPKPSPEPTPGGDTLYAYTEKALVETLIKLASGSPPSSYKAKAPWNLLYWDGSRWWADCVNLYKALFNGRSIIDPKPGSYQSDLSATGDCTERQLMNQCTDRSNNFKALGDHFRCLYMGGHFGGYLGFEMEVKGQGIINCVECTPRWEDGIQYSYVDQNGGRSWAKGKLVEGYWEEHGLATKWIDYSGSEPSPAPQPTPTPAHPEMNKDKFVEFLPMLQKNDTGDFVTLLQKCLRYTGDYTDAVDGSFGPNTTLGVKAYQQRCGLYVDGIVGPKTWRALIG